MSPIFMDRFTESNHLICRHFNLRHPNARVPLYTLPSPVKYAGVFRGDVIPSPASQQNCGSTHTLARHDNRSSHTLGDSWHTSEDIAPILLQRPVHFTGRQFSFWRSDTLGARSLRLRTFHTAKEGSFTLQLFLQLWYRCCFCPSCTGPLSVLGYEKSHVISN